MASKLSLFLAELKRRKVGHVAVLYVVVGIGVIEAADLILPTLYLPDWIYRLVVILVLAGFPLALALGWSFDLTRKGIQRTEALELSEAEEVVGEAKSPRTPARLAFILLVTLVSVGVGWVLWSRPAMAFSRGDWILITDFENLTGEEIFDGSLYTAMTVGIQQSQYVNVFPRTRVQETLTRMRREDAETLDVELGSEIALREGIKGLLACSIGKVGNEYLLTAQLLDPRTQETVYAHSAQAAGQDDVLNALDELAVDVRERLGESLASISETSLALPAATTSSLEALKAFSEGRVSTGSVRIDLFEQALELDPDFALAHADLGVQRYIANAPEAGEEHFTKALALLDRLTVRERLWIKAVVEDWRGNREAGIKAYETYLAQYPEDDLAWFRLGYSNLITNRPERAIEAFQRVLDLDPEDVSSLINTASCYNMLEENEEAASYYERAFSLDPEAATGVFVNHEYGNLLIRMGRVQDARENFLRMTRVDDMRRVKGYRSLGLLSTYLGKYSDAEGYFREAIVLNQSNGQPLSEMRDRLYLATVYRMQGRTEDFEKQMAAAVEIEQAINAGASWLLTIGTIFARAGRIDDAVARLQEIRERLGDPFTSTGVARWQRRDEACYHALQGEIALARGAYAEAQAFFEQARSRIPENFLESLAVSLLAQGDTVRALDRYQEFLASKRVGSELQEIWVMAHFDVGTIYEAWGRTEEAISYYRQFLDLWKEADQDLAPLVDARGRLARLTAETR